MTDLLLSVQNLSIGFPTSNGLAYAVNQLSLTIAPGQIVGIVGESGCGKSLTSLAILGLVPSPGKIVSGEIIFNGQDLRQLSSAAMRAIRGARIALIPQDPLTALNPVYTVGSQIMEVLMLHEGLSRKDARKKAIELLDLVRIPDCHQRIDDYPHQFSGGMRQRVMIAMALSCHPQLLIADEPTTALDVTVQAQILALLKEIKSSHNTAIMLITHDLGVVAEMCDQVTVMYAGRSVERSPVKPLFASPRHPYTKGLLASLPTPGKQRLEPIEGYPPSLTEIPAGCLFEPRCKERLPVCNTAFPASVTIGEQDVCCHLF
jgi:oligopeptide/dipeptide ABC transporter ATP-binding protein